MKNSCLIPVSLAAIILLFSDSCHTPPKTEKIPDSTSNVAAVAAVAPVNIAADEEHFSVFNTSATGDLNKDNIKDSVVVVQDTIADKAPYRLQVFFGQPDNQYRLVAESKTAILPQYPGGRDGYRDGISFDSLLIKNGIMTLELSLLRGSASYLYRYQHERFELIGFSRDESNGQGTIISEQYNLSTGRYIRSEEPYDGEDRPSFHRDTVVKMSPLPIIDTLTPFSTYYKDVIFF